MKKIWAIPLLAIILPSCAEKEQPSLCSDSGVKPALLDMLDGAVAKDARKLLDNSKYEPHFSQPTVAGAFQKAEVSLKAVRTVAKSDDGAVHTCAAEVRFALPSTVMNEFDEAVSNIGEVDKSEIASEAGVEEITRGFSHTIEYTAQLTDAGDEVVVESDTYAPLSEALSKTLAMVMIADVLRDERRAEEEAERKELVAEQERQQKLEAAQRRYSQAQLDSAVSDNARAARTIAALWSAVPESRKADGLRQQQSDWNQSTTARCDVEAARASADPTVARMTKLRCETRAINSRISYLRRFARY